MTNDKHIRARIRDLKRNERAFVVEARVRMAQGAYNAACYFLAMAGAERAAWLELAGGIR